MIDLVSKIKERRTYALTCAVPLLRGEVTQDPAGYERVETTRTIDLGPGETRPDLPDAVADSPDIQRAVKLNWVGVRRHKPTLTQKEGAKPPAAPKTKAPLAGPPA